VKGSLIRLAKYAVHRLLMFIPVLLGVATITFLLIYVIPGDPVLSLVGERYDSETLDELRADMHLDDPLPVRYAYYIGGLVRLDPRPVLRYRHSRLGFDQTALSVYVPPGFFRHAHCDRRRSFCGGGIGMEMEDVD